MRTTAVDHSYLTCEPLENSMQSGFEISTLEDCPPFILQRPIMVKTENLQKVTDQRIKYQS